eukprot:SAG11_NODE_54_length_19571_cov_29.437786_13_plen_127_part_00
MAISLLQGAQNKLGLTPASKAEEYGRADVLLTLTLWHRAVESCAHVYEQRLHAAPDPQTAMSQVQDPGRHRDVTRGALVHFKNCTQRTVLVLQHGGSGANLADAMSSSAFASRPMCDPRSILSARE